LIYRVRVAENLQKPAPNNEDDEEREDTKTVWAVPVGRSPVRGSVTAPITIVEFSDFQCPYCKRVEPTLEQLRTKYGAKLRFVWKDEPLPFHPRALPAAELARFARSKGGDAAFWDMHDRLFASQPKLEDSDLEGLARAANLDARAAMAAVNAKAYAAAIEEDTDLGEEVQASGTPHFFVNGRRLVGAQPVEKFSQLIDEEIAKTDALVRAGTAPAAVYDTLMKGAKKAPDPETKTVAPPRNAPFRGPANAKVVIQEFADFQCPFCARAEPTVDDLLKANPSQVKVVWRDLPLPMHQAAPLAAEAAREVFAQKGNDGFAKMRKLLFAGQQRGIEGLERPALEEYAKSLGVDMKRFNAALDNHTHKAAIDEDAKAAADAGISGTPAFMVGPYFVNGAQPLAKFQKLVNRTLSGPPPAPVQAATPPPAPISPALGIVDLTVGTGRVAKSGDTAVVHYVGTLPNGTEFDSSRKRGETFNFQIGAGRVIKGWDQGLPGMKIGGRRKLTIPPELAYGDRGVSPKIPPNATLLFEVELIDLR
jgi:protein-disulfide isomerase